MSQTKIILHWLNYSRSNRILWLLELLNVNYELKIYERNSAFRGPKELSQVHPLGKSPVIEVIKEGKEPEVIAESGRIIEYLIDTFDHSHQLNPESDEGKGEVSYYLHYTEGTLQAMLTGYLVLDMASNVSPFGFKTIVKIVTGKVNQAYFGTEVLKNMDYLENIAKKNDGGYFVDHKLTGADVALSYPLVELVFGGKRSSIFDKDPKLKYPYLYKWSQLITNDKAYIKANELTQTKSKL